MPDLERADPAPTAFTDKTWTAVFSPSRLADQYDPSRRVEEPVQSAHFKRSIRRSQLITWFQLAQFWSTNFPKVFGVGSLPASLAASAFRS